MHADWASIALLGGLHGVNPAMGWLFAVSLGMQAQSGRAVWLAVGPLALGHALAVAAAVAAAAVLGTVFSVSSMRWLAAAAAMGRRAGRAALLRARLRRPGRAQAGAVRALVGLRNSRTYASARPKRGRVSRGAERPQRARISSRGSAARQRAASLLLSAVRARCRFDPARRSVARRATQRHRRACDGLGRDRRNVRARLSAQRRFSQRDSAGDSRMRSAQDFSPATS